MPSPDTGGPPGQTQSGESNGGHQSKWAATKSWIDRWRGSRQLVLVIVAIALLLDNMLLTVVGKFIYNFNKSKRLFIYNITEHNSKIFNTKKKRIKERKFNNRIENFFLYTKICKYMK